MSSQSSNVTISMSVALVSMLGEFLVPTLVRSLPEIFHQPPLITFISALGPIISAGAMVLVGKVMLMTWKNASIIALFGYMGGYLGAFAGAFFMLGGGVVGLILMALALFIASFIACMFCLRTVIKRKPAGAAA